MKIMLDAFDAGPLLRITFRSLVWPFQWLGYKGDVTTPPAVRALTALHALASLGGMTCLLMDGAGNTMSATTVDGRESIHWFMDTDSIEAEKRIGINVREPTS